MKGQPVLFISGTVLFFTLACMTFTGGVEDQTPLYVPSTPTMANLLLPSPEPALEDTPVPIPAFEKSILPYSYGGGGSFCQFEVPPAPSVVGGTTYNVEPVSDPVPLGVYLYPRGAEICISGAPLDQPILVELISPDGGTTLTAEITLTQDPVYDFAYNVNWNGVSQDPIIVNGGHSLGIGAYRDDPGSPINVDLMLWWPGLLPDSTWQARVSWAGQSLLGEFQANIRNLPEISLYDPDFESRLFPSVDAGIPYTCRIAPATAPYVVVVEHAQPNSLVYVLVYSISPEPGEGGERADFYQQTFLYTDTEGNGLVELSADSFPAGKYYLFGVPEEVTALAWDDGFQPNAFSFAAVANAMDCFVVP